MVAPSVTADMICTIWVLLKQDFLMQWKPVREAEHHKVISVAIPVDSRGFKVHVRHLLLDNLSLLY